MKPESKTTLKIGNTVIDAEDLDQEEKTAFIEFAIHLAAPRIAELPVEANKAQIEDEEKEPKTTEHDTLLFDMPPVLTVQEVAKYLRVSNGKVYDMCRIYGGDFFPHFKVGNRFKIPRNEFIEWLREGGMEGYHKKIAEIETKRAQKKSPLS